MAKYPHNEDTLIVLKDIENRLVQLKEAGEAYKSQLDPKKYEGEQQGLDAGLMIVRQAIKHGHVFRGSSFVPDGLLPYVKTPSPTETLTATNKGVKEDE